MRRALLLTASTAAFSAIVTACGSKGSGVAGAGAGSGLGGSGFGGSGPADAGYDVASGPHATVRVADFARPLLLYLDVCFAAEAPGPSATWAGPMLRGSYASISNSDVSPYFAVAAGTRAVRFVLEDSPDCTQTLAGVPDFELATPLAEGTRSTLLFGGTGLDAGARPLAIFQLTDESDRPDGANSVRFVNAAQAESSLDVFAFSGFGMKMPCSLLYDGIPYGAAGSTQALPGDGGPTDANGYAPLRGENLYQITFSSLGYADHGAGCASAFGGLYSTDGELGQGAWTVFVEDEGSMNVICRDDGTSSPFCTTH